ncbi:MAG: hypothetical protein ACRC6V_03295 [Bacteroidales bacterium]
MTTGHFLAISLALVVAAALIGVAALMIHKIGMLNDEIEFHKDENKKLKDLRKRNADIDEITNAFSTHKEEARRAKQKLTNERDHLQRKLIMSKRERNEVLNQAFQCYRLLFSQDRNKSFAKRKLAALKAQAKAVGLRGQIDEFPIRKKL